MHVWRSHASARCARTWSSTLSRRLSRCAFGWVLIAFAALILPRSVRASEDLDVAKVLARPGVRLVAVEFYATWCEPCMKAMPRWKALKEKYFKDGLRVVVVNTLDPDGGCRSLGWVPDESVCDLEGQVNEALRIGGKLPAAFLWSWQGNLLVQAGHIDEVERAIDKYLAEAPRVSVDVGEGVPSTLATAVREAILDSGKVQVLAGAEERKAIEDAKRQQQNPRFEEKYACELGKELPPNSLLKIARVAQGKSSFLNVGLYDLVGGCQQAQASATWEGDEKTIAREAVGKLLQKLERVGGVQQPAGKAEKAPRAAPTKRREDKVVNAEDRNWSPAVDGASLVRFESTPKGARVEVDGSVKCEKTPCSRMLDHGRHVLRMTLAKHEEREEVLLLEEERRVLWSLEKSETEVRFSSNPAGAGVDVDGVRACPRTPCAVELKPGVHRVRMTGERIVEREEDVEVSRPPLALSWELESDTASVSIQTSIFGAPIAVDGEHLGVSPLKVQLTTGPHRVSIEGICFEDSHADITVERAVGKTVSLSAVRKMAGMRVELRDTNREPTEGDVIVDGTVVGRTWKTLTVPACTDLVTVDAGGVTWRKRVTLEANATTTIEDALSPRSDAVKAPPVTPPAPVPSAAVTQTHAPPCKREDELTTGAEALVGGSRGTAIVANALDYTSAWGCSSGGAILGIGLGFSTGRTFSNREFYGVDGEPHSSTMVRFNYNVGYRTARAPVFFEARVRGLIDGATLDMGRLPKSVSTAGMESYELFGGGVGVVFALGGVANDRFLWRIGGGLDAVWYKTKLRPPTTSNSSSGPDSRDVSQIGGVFALAAGGVVGVVF